MRDSVNMRGRTSKDDFARWIEESTARSTDWRIDRDGEAAMPEVYPLRDLAEWWTMLSPRQRKPRKPSIRARIAAAEKAGKTVTSVTLPDGTVLQFGEATTQSGGNSWDEVLVNAEDAKRSA